MRLRNVPQPRLRSRNRLIITLSSAVLGAGILLAVWVATQQSHAGPVPASPYTLPVTLSLRPQSVPQQGGVPASEEIASTKAAFELLESGKAKAPEMRLETLRHRQQLQLLREIEDHEMRLALRASHAEFDPEPYRSKIHLLRAKLQKMPPAGAGDLQP